LNRQHKCFESPRLLSGRSLTVETNRHITQNRLCGSKQVKAWLQQLELHSKRRGTLFRLLQLRVLSFDLSQDTNVG